MTSPEIVTVLSFSGTLDFNPETDSIKTPDGKEFRFQQPNGDELPSRGFDAGENTFQVLESFIIIKNFLKISLIFCFH